ncbi:MAG: Ig-like domain-containing protein, partial [Opitutales bacterium]
DPFELTGYATSGQDLTYVSSNTSVATISGSIVTVVAEGTTTITASQAGDSHYTAATSATQDLEVVAKQSQTITFAIFDQGLGTTHDLNGTASSGLAVTYAITSGASLATLNGNQLTFTGTGQMSVKASQAGNSEYFPAPDVEVTFQIAKGQIMVFQAIGNQGVGDTAALRGHTKDALSGEKLNKTALPITFSVLSGGASINIVNGQRRVICTSLGPVTLKAAQDGNGTYAPVSDTVTFTIGNKQGQEIQFPDHDAGEAGGLRNLPLGRRPFNLPQIRTNRNLEATLTVESIGPDDLFTRDGRKIHLQGKGFIKVTASHAGNAQYYAAAPVSRIFEIKQPGRGAFFDERRTDSRHDAIKTQFIERMQHLVDGLTAAEAAALFDEDTADSDGDGVSNMLERAFGMDSLGPDSRKSLPRTRVKSDGKQRITFVRYKTADNAENIQYTVELSTDLRVWMSGPSSVTEESAVDIGGGMERVTYVTTNAVSAGGRQYLRLTVTSP